MDDSTSVYKKVYNMAPKAAFFGLSNGMVLSLYPFFPDYSVFQFQTKLFSFFYCPVHLLNSNFIILNLNLLHMEKLIIGVKRSAAHNKVTVF